MLRSSILCRKFSQQSTNEAIKAIPREVRTELRKKTFVKKSSKSKSTSSFANFTKFVALAGTTATGIWFGFLDDESKSRYRVLFNDSVLGDCCKFLSLQIEAIAKPFTDPSREKLLPDWPLPGVPPNVPCPPTLILDLEDTLVHSEWDRRYGWRHAKRPGVDKFLETLARHYEIVVFSKHASGISDPIISLLDKKGYVLHRLFRDSTRYMNGTHVKDITNINRPLSRTIIIDDEPNEYQLHPQNAIPIKPYLDGTDRSDTELLDLIPFLQAVANERVQDIPKLLDEFRNSDGTVDDLASKYQARVSQLRYEQIKKREQGLGGLLRGRVSQYPSSTPSKSHGNWSA